MILLADANNSGRFLVYLIGVGLLKQIKVCSNNIPLHNRERFEKDIAFLWER